MGTPPSWECKPGSCGAESLPSPQPLLTSPVTSTSSHLRLCAAPESLPKSPCPCHFGSPEGTPRLQLCRPQSSLQSTASVSCPACGKRGLPLLHPSCPQVRCCRSQYSPCFFMPQFPHLGSVSWYQCSLECPEPHNISPRLCEVFLKQIFLCVPIAHCIYIY